MDLFSALDLASNLVQFIGCGSELISERHDIYKSVLGSSTGSLELELIQTDLNELTKSLRGPGHPNNQSPTADEAGPRQLTASCHTVAPELLNVVKTSEVDNDSNHRKWRSFR